MGNPVSFAGARGRLDALGLQMLGNPSCGSKPWEGWSGRLATPGAPQPANRALGERAPGAWLGLRDSCHRRALDQCLFDSPPLLRDAAPLPLGSDRAIYISRSDRTLLKSIHLYSKWTPMRSVPFARMALIWKVVETVTTGRLPAALAAQP